MDRETEVELELEWRDQVAAFAMIAILFNSYNEFGISYAAEHAVEATDELMRLLEEEEETECQIKSMGQKQE